MIAKLGRKLLNLLKIIAKVIGVAVVTFVSFVATIAVYMLLVPAQPGVYEPVLDSAPPTETPEETPYKSPLPEILNQLSSASAKRLVLEEANSVSFRGPVTEESVDRVLEELMAKSRTLKAGTPIYLVLDTPGGSVIAGMRLIDSIKALPRRVITVTLFAASMGFNMVQALDERLITPTGTLMSHRASVGGMSGQVNGELEVRVRNVKRAVDFLDFVAAKRMGIGLEEYRAAVLNEMWVFGFDSLERKVADSVVLVACGESLSGKKSIKVATLFGRATVEFSACPLIRAPLEVRPDAEDLSPDSRKRIFNMYANPESFVKDYILTEKFNKFEGL